MKKRSGEYRKNWKKPEYYQKRRSKVPEEQNDDISEDCENCEIIEECNPWKLGYVDKRIAHLAACKQ